MGDVDDVRGIWLDPALWESICERARFCCPFCGDPPEVEDAEFFVEEGCCRHCDSVWSRFMSE